HGSTCCKYIEPPRLVVSVVWIIRTRGILIERPDRSQGMTAGLSSEPPGRSPSWARVAGWNAWTSKTADAAATARASRVRVLLMGTLDGSGAPAAPGRAGAETGFPSSPL